MTEGTLARWLKKEGDAIKAGDVIAEIETDKATMEVEAVDEGVLGKILINDGTENVKVNAPIAILVDAGESVRRRAPAASAPPAAKAAEPPAVAKANPPNPRPPSLESVPPPAARSHCCGPSTAQRVTRGGGPRFRLPPRSPHGNAKPASTCPP